MLLGSECKSFRISEIGDAKTPSLTPFFWHFKTTGKSPKKSINPAKSSYFTSLDFPSQRATFWGAQVGSWPSRGTGPGGCDVCLSVGRLRVYQGTLRFQQKLQDSKPWGNPSQQIRNLSLEHMNMTWSYPWPQFLEKGPKNHETKTSQISSPSSQLKKLGWSLQKCFEGSTWPHNHGTHNAPCQYWVLTPCPVWSAPPQKKTTTRFFRVTHLGVFFCDLFKGGWWPPFGGSKGHYYHYYHLS